MEDIYKKREIINEKLNHLAHETNNANHRKLKNKLMKELSSLDENARNILTTKFVAGDLTLEKFEVTDAARYKTGKGLTLYHTYYAPIENQPAAFIGSECLLKELGIFSKDMTEKEIRKTLCKEQRTNDQIIKQEEEEEEYEEIVIPKTQKKKHK